MSGFTINEKHPNKSLPLASLAAKASFVLEAGLGKEVILID